MAGLALGQAGMPLELPAKIIDVNFASDVPGEPPATAGEESVSARKENPDWEQFPLTIPDRILFTSDLNTVIVEDQPLGMSGRGLLLSTEELPLDNDRTSGIEFDFPFELMRDVQSFSFSMDVVKRELSNSGSIAIMDVGRVVFRHNGQILVSSGQGGELIPIGTYEPYQPVKITFEVEDASGEDWDRRTFQILIDGDTGTMEPQPWSRLSGGAARHIQLLNTATGGYAEVPSQMAVGNIEMTIKEWK